MRKVVWPLLVIFTLVLSITLVVCTTKENNGRDDDGGPNDDVDDDTSDDDTSDDDTTDDDTTDDDTTDDDTTDDDTATDATISGQIKYNGEHAADSEGKNISVMIFASWPPTKDKAPVCGAAFPVPALGFPYNYDFVCHDIVEAQYYPMAYLDLNGDNQFDNTQEPYDYPGPPITIKPGDSIDYDIHLVDIVCSNPATMSGTITYTGQYAGSAPGKHIYIGILDKPIQEGEPPVYFNNVTVPGGGFPFNYSFNNVCLNDSVFYPMAYLDVDQDTQFDFGVEPWDAKTSPMTFTFGNTTDVDLGLVDPTKK